jgi:hypothetical protein
MELDHPEFIYYFCNLALRNGLILSPDKLKIGELVKCQVEGDTENEANGLYLLHLDSPDGSPTGYVQNIKTGVKDPYFYKCEEQGAPTKQAENYAKFKAQGNRPTWLNKSKRGG